MSQPHVPVGRLPKLEARVRGHSCSLAAQKMKSMMLKAVSRLKWRQMTSLGQLSKRCENSLPLVLFLWHHCRASFGQMPGSSTRSTSKSRARLVPSHMIALFDIHDQGPQKVIIIETPHCFWGGHKVALNFRSKIGNKLFGGHRSDVMTKSLGNQLRSWQLTSHYRLISAESDTI